MAGRFQQQAERLLRSRKEILDDSRKRALPEPTANNNGDTKRQRLEAGAQPNVRVLETTPWAPGPQSLANVFTLTNTRELAAFNATLVPCHLAARISTATLASVDVRLLDQALDVGSNPRRSLRVGISKFSDLRTDGARPTHQTLRRRPACSSQS